MGLQIMELICATEEEFEITMDIDQAVEIATVGEFYQYILENVDKNKWHEINFSEEKFQMLAEKKLQKALSHFNESDASINDDTFLEEIIPFENRRAHWESLENSLECRLPELCFSKAQKLSTALAIILTVTLIAIVFVKMIAIPGFVIYMIWFFSLLVAMGLLIPKLQSKYGKYIPKSCVTFANIKYVITHYYSYCEKDQVWKTLCEIISSLFDVDPKKIRPDTHFQHDLCID